MKVKSAQVCTLEKEGFRGYYFEGNRETQKAIIVVGGAFCSEKMTLKVAQNYVDTGYSILVLGFYLWRGLSRNMASIPIDYCENAVKWLQEKKHIQKIAMTGVSTGAGYSMVCASYISDITCVIAVAPYDHVMEGTSATNKRMHCSVYSYHGEDVPYYITDALEKGLPWWFRQAKKAKGYGASRFMRWGYDQCEKTISLESRIKTENMNADVLLLAAQNDDCWPSDVAVPRIVKNLKNVGYAHRVDYHIYERGSHILIDGIDRLDFITRKILKTIIPAEKKFPSECEQARKDSFKRTLKFIEEW